MNVFLLSITLFVAFFKMSVTANQAVSPVQTSFIKYEAKNYDSLLSQVKGFDSNLLTMHFKLYQGYVTNSNATIQALQELSEKGESNTPAFGALKKNLSWEIDGMLLHEYYFENLGGSQPLSKSDPLYVKIKADFGSYDKWRADFVATGLIRGIGWVVTYIEPKSGRLVNEWIEEHNLGHLAGAIPLVIMDVFEHAYITQFGLDRAKYIDIFFNNINWKTVSQRFNRSSQVIGH